MDTEKLKQKINQIKQQREALVKLLDQPQIGSLKTDVVQALEELDELIDEFNLTFSLS